MQHALRRVAFALLGSPIRAGCRLQKIKNNRHLTFLNLHRVGHDDRRSYKPLDPYLFEQLLKFLIKNFTITTFLELEQFAGIKNLEKPLLIISFDDGYKDFIEVTVPILFKYGIRVNQNLIPECIESGQPPLNVAMQDFVGKSSEEHLQILSIPGFMMGSDLSNRINIGFRISNHLKNKPLVEQRQIKNLVIEQLGGVLESQGTPMMSLSDIKQIIGLHEFGAHSYSHSNMAFESDEFVKSGMLACKQWFRKKSGARSFHLFIPKRQPQRASHPVGPRRRIPAHSSGQE